MGRKRYTPEFRAQIIELHAAGKAISELAREFEPSAPTICSWIKQAELDTGRRTDGLTTAEKEEMRWMKREIKRLRMERDILAKAAAWFARETDSLPKRSSN